MYNILNIKYTSWNITEQNINASDPQKVATFPQMLDVLLDFMLVKKPPS